VPLDKVKSDVEFDGKVEHFTPLVKIIDANGHVEFVNRYELSIHRVFRGGLGTMVTVETDDTNCRQIFTVGKKYHVRADLRKYSKDTVVTSVCFYNTLEKGRAGKRRAISKPKSS